MNNKANFWLYLVLALVVGIGLGRYMPSARGTLDIKGGKVDGIIEIARRLYVDTVSVDGLEETAIKALLKNLDPHSAYIPPKDLQEANEDMLGSFEGIGVQFRVINDTVVVITPIPGGPSAKAGLRSGDRIVTVDGDTIAGKKLSTQDIVKRLKGPKHSKVNLGIWRSSEKYWKDYEVERNVIPNKSVEVAFLARQRPGMGYIRISKFSSTTYEEFVTQVEKLQQQSEQPLQELMIDLRGNVGGILYSSVKIADMFLDRNDMIVYTKGLHRGVNEIRASGRGPLKDLKLILLMDEWTASASEILAGAIQDNDRGVVLGKRSFGKGLVQEHIELADHSAIRLTVSRYYTPSGRCIQKSYNKSEEEYEMELVNRYATGELIGKDSGVIHTDTVRYYTKNGRVVYGGGGIEPDIKTVYQLDPLFVYLNTLSSKGVILDYAFQYTDAHRKEMEEYRTVEDFLNRFEISDALLEDFVAYAEVKGVQRNPRSIRKYGDRLKNDIKAYIAQDLFGDEGFYPITLQDDSDYLKALESFDSIERILHPSI